MRYYSTKRPVTPGSYPKQKFAVKIHNFEQKTFCKEIGCEAWGYIEYSIELPEADIEDYELLSENLKTFWAVTTAFYDDGRVVANITNKLMAAVKPENSSKSLKRKKQADTLIDLGFSADENFKVLLEVNEERW